MKSHTPSVDARSTKYTVAVIQFIQDCGHATNQEILDNIRRQFPNVSATTIHRITSRLVERGEVQYAPSGSENVYQFDANVSVHDHFMCSNCGMLRDANLGAFKHQIEQEIGDGCAISGNIVVSGLCKKCNKESES